MEFKDERWFVLKKHGCNGFAWATGDFLPWYAFSANSDNLKWLDALKNEFRDERRTYWSESGYDTDGIERKLRVDCNPRPTSKLRPRVFSADPKYANPDERRENGEIFFTTQIIFVDLTEDRDHLADLSELIEQVRQLRAHKESVKVCLWPKEESELESVADTSSAFSLEPPPLNPQFGEKCLHLKSLKDFFTLEIVHDPNTVSCDEPHEEGETSDVDDC